MACCRTRILRIAACLCLKFYSAQSDFYREQYRMVLGSHYRMYRRSGCTVYYLCFQKTGLEKQRQYIRAVPLGNRCRNSIRATRKRHRATAIIPALRRYNERINSKAESKTQKSRRQPHVKQRHIAARQQSPIWRCLFCPTCRKQAVSAKIRPFAPTVSPHISKAIADAILTPLGKTYHHLLKIIIIALFYCSK